MFDQRRISTDPSPESPDVLRAKTLSLAQTQAAVADFDRTLREAEDLFAELEKVVTQPREADAVAYSPLETVLEKGEVATDKLLGGGANVTRILKIVDDGQAIFKPKSGESRHAVTEIGTGYKRERAAYLVDLFLNFGLVPPTVLKQVGAEVGSAQRYIEEHKDSFRVDRSPRETQFQLARMALLDFVIANSDRHEGNWLMDSQNKIWAIDHGLSFQREIYEHHFIANFSKCLVDPGDHVKILALADSPSKRMLLEKLLVEFLEKKDIDACFERLDRLARSVRKATGVLETVEEVFLRTKN